MTLRSVIRLLREGLRWLGDQLYPPVCPVCGAALGRGERTVCLRCRWEMPLTDDWMAERNPVVGRMERSIPELHHVSSFFAFRHESGYRRMIHALKYAGRRDIAVAMGEMFGRELRESPFYRDIDLLVPVPLHWTKRLRRGYNQAEEICVGLSRSLGVSCDFRSLRRVRRTQTQARRRDAAERRRNVDGAFRLTRPARLAGRHILLVDDVLTSGATLAACAAAIRHAAPGVRISVAALASVRGGGRR